LRQPAKNRPAENDDIHAIDLPSRTSLLKRGTP